MADRSPDRLPPICPTCGSDTYKAKNFDRVRDQATFLRRELATAMAKLGIEQAERRLERWNRQKGHSYEQMKVHRQAQEIKRLQAALSQRVRHPDEAADFEASQAHLTDLGLAEHPVD